MNPVLSAFGSEQETVDSDRLSNLNVWLGSPLAANSPSHFGNKAGFAQNATRVNRARWHRSTARDDQHLKASPPSMRRQRASAR